MIDLEEIKANAPKGATHYYVRFGDVLYLKKIFHNQYDFYFDGDWLCRKLSLEFRLMLKPL